MRGPVDLEDQGALVRLDDIHARVLQAEGPGRGDREAAETVADRARAHGRAPRHVGDQLAGRSGPLDRGGHPASHDEQPEIPAGPPPPRQTLQVHEPMFLQEPGQHPLGVPVGRPEEQDADAQRPVRGLGHGTAELLQDVPGLG